MDLEASGVPVWLQFAVNAGVPAATMLYLVIIGMPKIVREFRDEMKVERESHERELTQLRDELRNFPCRADRPSRG